ncbi:hypothetical protein Curi_c23470 [Gottschalkia acidurici 9a]|uniref:Uncharacterized protein n=1 Tax=Gottschalkia acidurici (strain ATCC 7906 / DSM 604 / BCRC 14475 / CIP 104303 / KCTC 5404 / NCIMB 10678 / 9a) TaxID=1128398 RepID=K0AZX6_GOTA9|nr:class 1 isoprenoid biosynthesis enzyme [Gottschalkia acidurici]AFS79348.1 hypothetical protein Curi_c23470 [Gottschalkia acidurici 9a]
MDSKERLLEDLKTKYKKTWIETKDDFPDFLEKISFLKKITNEINLEKFRKKLSKFIVKIREKEKLDNKSRDKILLIIKELENSIIGYGEDYIDFFIKQGYIEVTEEFIDKVKIFDSNMDIHDTFQAIRNVWIMNSIQILYDMKVELTQSVFAYSMLYPYSDNYLDDKNISLDDKIKFNTKFRKWLLGDNEITSNLHEKHIYDLVKKIESEFSREEYKQVFRSLLDIHKSQEKSLIQHGQYYLSIEDIIDITFEKGGTSVIADGYLVRGKLTYEEEEFMFIYGIVLQLIDDLQDVKEDLSNENVTIFTNEYRSCYLDKLTNKLFRFIKQFLCETNMFSSNNSEKLKKVIYESCIIMMLEAIAKNKEMFSKKYIKDIKKYSIFRFSYYKKLKNKFESSFSSNDISEVLNALKKDQWNT